MSRLHRMFTCGLLAAAVTGCQSTRNTADYIVHWRPFGNHEQKTEVAADVKTDAEAELAEQPVVAELGAQQAPTAADLDKNLTVQEVSQETASNAKMVVAEDIQEQKKQSSAPVDNSFEAFIREMEQQEQQPADDADSDDGLPPAMPLVTEKSTPAEAVNDQADPAVEDALSAQIGKLLAEYEPEHKPAEFDIKATTEEKTNVAATDTSDPAWASETAAADKQDEANHNKTAIKQVTLTQTHDAGLVAYDLASFADVSINRQAVAATPTDMKSPATDFASWVKQTTAKTASTAEQVAVTAQDGNEEFDWAKLNSNIQNLVTKDACSADNQAAESACVASQALDQCEIPKTKVKKTPASSEVLKILEQALGSEDWKKAELTVQADQQQLTAEQQKILEMLHHKNYQVRLRGIRLTYENSQSSSPLTMEIVHLLKDENQLVRAHAASTLFHWNLSVEDAIETLAGVVTSSEGNAAQLAAMFLGDMDQQHDKVVPVLKTALLSTQGITTLHVAEALLKHEPANVDAVARLTELMRDQDVEVRWLTAHALGGVQGELQPYAVEALRAGLRDIDSQVRATSALSLGGLGKASQVAVAELTFISAHAEPKVRDAANIALECIIQ